MVMLEEQLDKISHDNRSLLSDLQQSQKTFHKHTMNLDKEHRAKVDQLEMSKEEDLQTIRCKYEKILHLFEEKIQRLQNLQSHQNVKWIKEQAASLNEQMRSQIEAEFDLNLQK